LNNGWKNVLPKKIFGKEVVFPDWVQNILKKTKEPEINNEKNGFDRIVDSLKEIAEMVITIRNTRGEISPEDSSEIERRMAQLASQKFPKLVSMFLAEARALLQIKKSGAFVHKTQEMRKYASENLSPGHQKFLEIGRYDKTKYFSIANDVIDTGTSLLLLKESEKSEETSTLENSYNFYKSYELIKEISYEGIVNEPEFFVKKGEESTKMLEVLSLIRQTPDLYHKFRKEVVAPQDPLEISFKGLMARMSLAIQLDEKEFYEVKSVYDQLHSQEQQIAFSEAFVILANEPESIKLFLGALGNRHFLEDRSWNNNLLDKLSEILELIEERNELTKELLTDAGEDTLDPWEYNEAIFGRLNSLLKDAIGVDSKEKANQLLKESDVFKKEIIAEGAVFRGNFDQIRKMKPEEIGDLLKNTKAQVVRGGDMIQDSWAMKNPDNYKFPNKFNVDDYQMLVKNLEQAYGKDYPKYLEVLKLNIAKDLQDDQVEFHLIKNKGALIGIVKIKKTAENCYYVGTLYAEEAFQKDFKVGQFLQESVLKGVLSEGVVVSACSAPLNPSLGRHLKSGWEIVGEKTEKAVTQEGEAIESEQLLMLEMKGVKTKE